MPLSNADILCFANDWEADPTSKHHLMRHLAERHRVLWVEAAGMRAPNLLRSQDLLRIVRKTRAMVRPTQQVLDNLYVYAPPTIPLPTWRVARAVNSLLYRVTLQREQRRAAFRGAPVVWTFSPHVVPFLRRLPRQFLVYHCVDRWTAFRDYDAELMETWERQLCGLADIVFASAEDLAERCRAFGAEVHYVPHGVSYGHFNSALEVGPVRDDLASIPAPRVGFFGLIHEWVDLELVAELARQRPAYSFVLIGDSHTDTTPVADCPNVHLLGRRPFATLPAYCRGFAAAIVPFRMTELTKSVNPIKLREYAAAGLPIVSSDLPEVRRCRDIAEVAATQSAWLKALDRAVAKGLIAEERHLQSERVRDQDWAVVARRLVALIDERDKRRAR
ncbi:MAG: glycosyltransferase, partial [Gemmatimonadales bacterium]|nr:glycosyltransferase [Gemmatimonadales bacterium]